MKNTKTLKSKTLANIEDAKQILKGAVEVYNGLTDEVAREQIEYNLLCYRHIIEQLYNVTISIQKELNNTITLYITEYN